MPLQFKITFETGVTFKTLERFLGRHVNARHVVVVITARNAAFLFRMRVVNEFFATLTLVTIKISNIIEYGVATIAFTCFFSGASFDRLSDFRIRWRFCDFPDMQPFVPFFSVESSEAFAAISARMRIFFLVNVHV